jgi:putative hemolysin
MQHATRIPWTQPTPPALRTGLAACPQDVEASQRLRFQVFAEEMGARLPTAAARIDRDDYDALCHHLLVRETHTGEVVASTRILIGDRARVTGGFYSESEFDLGGIRDLPGRVMEVGRTCVRADHRNGAAIIALWTGLAGFMSVHGFDYMIGCASVPLPPESDRDAYLGTRALLQELPLRHAPEPGQRVTPQQPLPPCSLPASIRPLAPPPLLKAYLRLGARICGEACLDADFGVADLFILLDVRQVPERYQRHFLRRPEHQC